MRKGIAVSPGVAIGTAYCIHEIFVDPDTKLLADNEVTGELSIAFTGVTIAIPVIAAVAALAALDRLSALRGLLVAVLTGLAYLVATYLAQGAFKELFEAAFLLGFALWLREITRARERAAGGLLAFVPGAVIVQISDDGGATRDFDELRELAAAIGGGLRATPEPGGFRVRAWLPTEGQPPSP